MNFRDVGILAVRGAAGGTLVVVFALVGEVLKPKAFAGLFSSAPSVALASLTVTLVAESVSTARHDSIGMVIGAVGMAASCVVAVVAIPKIGAAWGSLVAWAGWAAVAMGLYWAVFVGAY